MPGATAKWTFVDDGDASTNDQAEIVISDKYGHEVFRTTGRIDSGKHHAHKD